MAHWKKFFTCFAAAVIGSAVVSCDKAYPPMPAPGFDNLADIAVAPVYTAIDSAGQRWYSDTLPANSPLVWQAGVAYRVSFVPNLISQYKDQPVLYNIYRLSESGENAILVRRTLGAYDGIPKSIVTYLSPSGKVDTVDNDRKDTIYDVVNPNALQPFRYGVRVTVELDNGGAKADFALGKEGAFTLSSVFSGGLPTRLSLDGGNPETGDNIVSVTGAFDTAGLSAVIVYRYSEIVALDSAGIIFNIVKMRDSLGASVKFPIGKPGDSLVVNADTTVTFIHLVNTSGGLAFYQYGKLGRIDTVPKSRFSSYFKSLEGTPQNTSVSFTRDDTLVDGLGAKWIAIQGKWDSTYRGSTWSPLFDNIKIANYSAKLLLDETRSRVRKMDFSGKKRTCLLDAEVPFLFDTYGDTTFSSNIQVWIATRSLSADFLVDGKFKNTSNMLSLGPVKGDVKFPDCLFETPPREHSLDEFGRVSGVVAADFERCRISPLAKSRNGIITMELQAVERTDAVVEDLVREIRPGSLLGYREANLDKPAQQAGFVDTVLTFKSNDLDPDKTRRADIAMGWYSAQPYSDTNSILRDSIWRAEYAKSFDLYAYRNPFQNLPFNGQEDVRKGYKEFIILVYTEGKYFHEPRVFLSTFTSDSRYVWDKIPPMILWSPYYNPALNANYAPIAYRDPKNPANNRVTNLSSLGNIFDVFLIPGSSPQKTLDPSVGVRDAGHGTIEAVTLCFHIATKAYLPDPATGLRNYLDGNPIKRFSLSPTQLQAQALLTYGPPGGDFKESYGIPTAFFPGIDASTWKPGTWEMWIETADDLGNRGMAPFGQVFNIPVGDYFIRNIEIK